MLKLYMLLLGASPKGRYIEQHDIFFGIGYSLKDLVPFIVDYWPEAKGDIHIDAWREITYLDGYEIKILTRITDEIQSEEMAPKLFFVHLGGYKRNEFEEFHYKMVVVSDKRMDAVKKAKQTVFYKHTGFKGVTAHIDEKYGIDVDDIYRIDEILPSHFKKNYKIQLTKSDILKEDEINLGYYKLNKL